MSLERLVRLVRYNRDWPKYLYHRYTSAGGRSPLRFRLRNGQVIETNWDARFTLNEIYLDHVYDIPGIDLRSCRSILDIGGNVGIFALYAASINPAAAIYSFEPVQANFALLQRNLKASAAVGRVRAYPMAVGSKCGTGHMKLAGTSVTHSLDATGAGGGDAVEIVDLDWIFETTGLERFDFVKMDIEGAEVEIMNTCTDEQLRRMKAISMEWHSSMQEIEPIVVRMRGLGFQTYMEVEGNRPRYLKAARQ